MLWEYIRNRKYMVVLQNNGAPNEDKPNRLYTTSPRIWLHKMEESWTLFMAILGVGFPLHKPYPYRLYVRIPPFYVPEKFGGSTGSYTKLLGVSLFWITSHKRRGSIFCFAPDKMLKCMYIYMRIYIYMYAIKKKKYIYIYMLTPPRADLRTSKSNCFLPNAEPCTNCLGDSSVRSGAKFCKTKVVFLYHRIYYIQGVKLVTFAIHWC